MKRKTFNLDGQIISAGGVLFFKNLDGHKEVFIQKNKYISDFGGKVENRDEDIYHTISREFLEEINNGILNVEDTAEYLSLNETKDLIKENKIKEIYIPRCKYFLIIAELPDEFIFDYELIGQTETYEDINRDVEWLSVDEFFQRRSELNPRLWGNEIKDVLCPTVLNKNPFTAKHRFQKEHK